MKYLRKIFYLLIFLNFSSILIGQTNSQIVNYYENINTAELKITKQDYNTALIYYKKSFKIRKGFGKDLNNAIICSSLSSKPTSHSFIYDVFKDLVRLGCELPYFEKEEFKYLRKGRKWKSFLRQYPKLHLEYHKYIDTFFRSSILKLYERDQTCRKKGSKREIENINIADSINYSALQTLIKSKGLPSEDRIGLFFSADKKFFIESRINVILLHAYQKKKYDFTQILLDGVQKGEISPNLYLILADIQSTNTGNLDTKLQRHSIIKVNNTFYYGLRKNEKQQEKKINENRKSIFKCSLNDDITKIVYHLANKELPFTFETGMGIGIYNFPPKQELEFIKELEKIEITDGQ